MYLTDAWTLMQRAVGFAKADLRSARDNVVGTAGRSGTKSIVPVLDNIDHATAEYDRALDVFAKLVEAELLRRNPAAKDDKP